jgi:ATP-binding cassette, subfamily C, bacterial CydD
MRALDPRLLRRARTARLLIGVDAAIGFATSLLVLLQGTLIAWIVVRGFDGEPAGSLAGALVLLAAIFAARGVLTWAFEAAGRRAATTVLSDLRRELVARRLGAQPAAHDGVEGAEITAAAVQGVDGLAEYFGRYLPQVVLACVVPVAVLVYVATIDATSALIMLATLPLVPVFMWLIGRYTEERTRERWDALQQLSHHFLEVVRGLPTLRAFNRSKAQAATLRDVGDRYRRTTMATLRIAFLSGSVLELAATLGVALVAVTVGVRLVDGSVGFQAALTVLVLAPELYLPLRRLGAQFHATADGLAGAARILELLETPDAVAHTGPLVAPSPAAAAVRLDRVSFAYPARAGSVLDRLTLELEPGATVVLAGASGAGKSTVASLLLRLAEPTSGRVLSGGVDLAGCDPAAWRRELAWVPQRPSLFRGTVADNIRLGEPEASDARVRRAAALAGVDEVVGALPHGYGTVVGDGGRVLSAGERRRIALARAFLRRAALMILDEPTADLDDDSAAVVADTLERLHGTCTLLVISHRPEVVRAPDRLVVLESGREHVLEASEVAA